MLNNNYRVTNENIWTGRIDSNDNFNAFRWHQWIKTIDLSDDIDVNIDNDLSFCFLGFCCDKGVQKNKGRAGAAKGPISIRKALSNLPCRFDKSIKLYDAGDIICENSSVEQCQKVLAFAVNKILSLGLFPIILGGGHEIALGNYNGILNNLKQKNNSPKIGIINFDAHFDIRPYNNGGTSGTMFRQIYDQTLKDDLEFSYFCIGIQKHGNTIDLFKTAENLGTKYILAKDISSEIGWNVLEKIDYFIKKQDYIYLTICSDVFSSAFAPGVSAAQPLGLHPETVLRLLKYILRTEKVISFDIAEVSPRFDQDNSTANLASLVIFSIINTLSSITND